ncbi:MAG: hypothetical protein KDD63_22965 [Bacteroidetes bacterium]|nr:hypothetical protein [Bacteroidota bacterium]MCB0842966.1 hypothetical protein [Bacteroidota bacterium]MCB0855109.1 hypothetical protein [Bacteroidota bacterium]
MPNRKDLPFLLSLLEDDSRIVREQVKSALIEFGNELEQIVAPYFKQLDNESKEKIALICDEIRQIEFSSTWLSWLDIKDSKSSLEYALIRLAYFEFGSRAFLIEDILTQLSNEFLHSGLERTPANLMAFLFQHKGFRSPRKDDNNYLNHNLLYVITNKEGSQVLLSCLAIILGARVGLQLDGINIQGNFMAFSYEEKKMQMFNSFNKGKPLARASVIYIEEAFRRNQIAPLQMKACVHEIILQVIKGIVEAHHVNGDSDSAKEYIDLYSILSNTLKERNIL